MPFEIRYLYTEEWTEANFGGLRTRWNRDIAHL